MMRDVKLLGNEKIEALVRAAGYETLESLAELAAMDRLTMVPGVGEKKAEEIKEALIRNGVRFTLSSEENLLVEIAFDNKDLWKELLVRPLTDEQKEYIHELLTMLSEREHKVICLRFGLGGEKPAGLEELGQRFNVTRERIRQIEAKAMRKLRHHYRNGGGELIFLSRAELQRRLFIAEKTVEAYKSRFSEAAKVGPIEDLDLTVRSYNCLVRAGIKTIEEARAADLSRVRNLGSKGAEEVMRKIEAYS